MCTAQTGRTHGCSDQSCNVKILLANPEPSTHGPKRTYTLITETSAYDKNTRRRAGCAMQFCALNLAATNDRGNGSLLVPFQGCRKMACNGFRRSSKRIAVEVRIAGSGRGLGMAQQSAEYRQT